MTLDEPKTRHLIFQVKLNVGDADKLISSLEGEHGVKISVEDRTPFMKEGGTIGDIVGVIKKQLPV